MREIKVAIDPQKIHRIAITCRCSKRFVAEIPDEVMRAGTLSVHECPGCGQPYGHDPSTKRLTRLHREGYFPEKVLEPGQEISIGKPDSLEGKYIHKGNDTIQ